MYTDIWRKCPGSQPHQPHLRGWAEGPGIQCISRVEGAVLWCFVWHPSAPTLVSFTCEGLLENYVFFHKELWTESKRSVELYRPLPIHPCYTHTHTHTHTHFGLGGEVAEGEGGCRKTLAWVPNSKQSLIKTVMCKLLTFIGPFGEYSCLSGNERECLCL